MTSSKPSRKISRRAFLTLAGLGAGAVGLVVLIPRGQQALFNTLDNLTPSAEVELAGWLHLAPDGRVTLMMPKAEMGQGVHTALQQIVAEELYLAADQVTVDPGDTTTLPSDARGTNGSNTISSLFLSLRQAAAQAREMIRAEAAKMLSAAPSAISMQAGVIYNAGQATELTYRTVIGDRQFVETLKAEDLPLKPIQDFRVIGQPVARVDIPAKVTGAAKYGYDARMEGMKYGKVLKPPTLGATLAQVDEAAAQASPGVLQVVRAGDFVGVVAETQEAAVQGLSALAAQWNERNPLWQQADIDRMLERDGGLALTDDGDVGAQLQQATRVLEATYTTPFAAHANLEAQAGLAHVRQEDNTWRADVWTATQGPSGLPGTIAEAIGLKAEQVVVHPLYLGGGFGRKVVNDAALEAARLSQATGWPVRVNWDRHEEFQHGFLRPPTRNTFRAGLSADGHVTAWDQQQVSGLVLFALLPAFLRSVFGSDFGATRGAIPPYRFASRRTIARMASDLPVKTASWRGLGLLPNMFAVESFMDELAHAAGQDPLAFRLAHLDTDAVSLRVTRALQRVRTLSHWDEPLATPAAGWVRGRGVAAGVDAKTVVAQVAEVAVNPATGDIKVERVYCALDAGLIINPDTVKAQIEGNIMWGVGSALIETLTVKDGRLSAANFGDYPLLTIRQAPDVVSELIENVTEGPFGMGEPPLGPVAPAIANAVFAAAGVRLRQLPMTPPRVLAALAQR